MSVTAFPYVAIKVLAGTPPCTQFSQLYPVLVTPAIYFIRSRDGIDLEVKVGNHWDQEIIQETIRKVKAALEEKAGEAQESNLAEQPPLVREHFCCSDLGTVKCSSLGSLPLAQKQKEK